MKKIFTIALIVLLVANIFGIVLSLNTLLTEKENNGINSDMDALSASDVVSDSDDISHEEEPQKTLELVQDINCPLPSNDIVIQRYTDYRLLGKISSLYSIENVTVTIREVSSTDADAERQYSVVFSTDDNVMSYDLSDSKNTESGKSLDELVDFAKLRNGNYELVISVVNTNTDAIVYSDTFTVAWSHYQKLTPSNFRNNYYHTLTFFGGDTAKFMFGYHVEDDGSKITIEKEWRKQYLTLTEVCGKKCYVHKDALPYIEKALAYAENTFVRVSGNGRDSGVIKLSSLIESFDGAYVPRRVRNDEYISHHSFGTAFDFNASKKPNTLSKENHAVIRSEVGELLIYNGIKEDDGIKYYDFSYNGTYSKCLNDVPYTVVNYLLYELAFYRADFGWGYYFTHNCDAMHYSLTEFDPKIHDAQETGLRKVFEYISESN